MLRLSVKHRCDEAVWPEDAHDSGHEGCCGTGCVEGVEVGSCCCERLRYARACAPNECWLEVDFGAAVAVRCMQYSVSGGEGGGGLRLQVWEEEPDGSKGRWVEPPNVSADDGPHGPGPDPVSVPPPSAASPAPPQTAAPSKPQGAGHLPSSATPQGSSSPAAPATVLSPSSRQVTRLRSVGPVARYGLPAQQTEFAWRGALISQRIRLVLSTRARGFWAESWRFFSNERCALPLSEAASRTHSDHSHH